MDTEGFKTVVKEYVKLTDQLQHRNVEIRELRKRRTVYEEKIMEYMTHNEIASCNLPNGVLFVSVKQTKKPANKGEILNRLIPVLESEDTANKVLDLFYNSKEVTSKNVLKHISNGT